VAVSDELVWLLHQIRSSSSPIERLKLLARGWRSVRELSADDRRRLARELGIDGAEDLVEQLARRGGTSPSNLLSMLHRAEETDPATVMDTIRGLGEPERRRAAAGELLDTAADILVDDEARPAQAPGPPGESTGNGAAEHAPPTPAPPPPARQEPSPPAASAVAGEPAQPSLAARPEALSVRPPPPLARRRPGAPERPGTRAAPQPSDAAASPLPRPPSETGLAKELGAESSLLSRLRLLTASVDRFEDAGIDELSAVLECFPAGWARRRALQRLLEAGVPRSVGDAVEMLDALQRPSERLWAATALATTRPLDDDERAALLAAVPSPALRRRLTRRRFGRGGE
jgi:hypothetical protein